MVWNERGNGRVEKVCGGKRGEEWRDGEAEVGPEWRRSVGVAMFLFN